MVYYIVITLLTLTNYVLHCQSSPSPTVYETLTGQNIEHCNRDENGFKIHSTVECLLFCNLERGKDALIENGTHCFCTSCNLSASSDGILKKVSERNSSSLTFYKEVTLTERTIHDPEGKIYLLDIFF